MIDVVTVILLGIGCGGAGVILGWALFGRGSSQPDARLALDRDRRRHRLGLGEIRLINAIGDFGREHRPPLGWKARVLARIKEPGRG